MRPGTFKNNISAQKLYLQFTMVFGIPADSPQCDDLAAYAEWLLQGGLATQTVRNHFSALRAMYQWVNNQPAVDVLSSSRWQMTIRGICNTIRPSNNVRAAMTPDDLLTILEACTWCDDLMPLTVALTFGFFGYLRISNLAPPTAHEFDQTRHTTVAEVFLRNEGLVLSLKWTKTRQRERNPVAVPLPALGDSPLCPFKAWRVYNNILRLQNTEVTPDTPLLLTTDERHGPGHHHTHVTCPISQSHRES